MRTIHLARAACLLGLASAALVGCGQSSEDTHARIRDDLKLIRTGLTQYAADNGGYPETLAQLEANDYPRSYRKGAKLPSDPWGEAYHYAFEDGRPVLACLGADRSPGGEGSNADVRITNLPRTR